MLWPLTLLGCAIRVPATSECRTIIQSSRFGQAPKLPPLAAVAWAVALFVIASTVSRLNAQEPVNPEEVDGPEMISDSTTTIEECLRGINRPSPTLSRTALSGGGRPASLLRSPQCPGNQITSKDAPQTTHQAWNQSRYHQIRFAQDSAMLSSNPQTWRCPAS